MIGKYVVVTGGEGDLASVISGVFRDAEYEIESPGRAALNVCDSHSINDFFRSRKIDLLVCCAGLTHDSLIARMAAADWDRVWQTNYLGAKHCAQAALPYMREQGHGHIVFFSSHSAFHPPLGQTAYAASKRALLALTEELSAEHGPTNIRVNAILPGLLNNRMTAHLSEARRETVLQEHVLGRFNTMDRVASFVRFLHESMPHTSGQWFQLDSRPLRF